MPKTKEISFNLTKKEGIVDAHKVLEGYTKLSQFFQLSRTRVKSIIKKFKEGHTVQNTLMRDLF